MNFTIILGGGLALYATTFLLSIPSGMLIHEGLLAATYDLHATFWRPELNANPPDMGALMPMWIALGLMWSAVVAALYGLFRPALPGSGWQRGLKFGLALGVFVFIQTVQSYGVFNLPLKLFLIWGAEGLAYTAIGCAVMGAVAEKISPSGT